ncbi:MAG: GNAT family N-acetyltransferase [Pseudomonadota bacterium]
MADLCRRGKRRRAEALAALWRAVTQFLEFCTFGRKYGGAWALSFDRMRSKDHLFMIRKADRGDISRIKEIRNSVRENKLRDPSRVKDEDIYWFIDNPGIFVWEEDSKIVGFSAADPRDGSIFALFMDEAYEGRGIGRALFDKACEVLLNAGCPRKWLTTWPGTRAEKFYRKAGWRITGTSDGNLVFEK